MQPYVDSLLLNSAKAENKNNSCSYAANYPTQKVRCYPKPKLTGSILPHNQVMHTTSHRVCPPIHQANNATPNGKKNDCEANGAANNRSDAADLSRLFWCGEHKV